MFTSHIMQMPRKHVKVFGKTNYADATPPRRARQKLIANFCAVQSLRSPPTSPCPARPTTLPGFLSLAVPSSSVSPLASERNGERQRGKGGGGKRGESGRRACVREREKDLLQLPDSRARAIILEEWISGSGLGCTLFRVMETAVRITKHL